MKKFLLLMFLVAIATVSYSQDKTAKMANESYTEISFTAADTISNNDTIYSIVFETRARQKATQNLLVELDSTSGTPTVDIMLQGRVFDTGTWVTIGDTVSWAGTAGDTTIYIANTSANRYRYYRVYFDANSTAQKSTITNVEFKYWLE